MLSPKIADLIGKIEQLPFNLQEALAEGIAADPADVTIAAKIANGESMPALCYTFDDVMQYRLQRKGNGDCYA